MDEIYNLSFSSGNVVCLGIAVLLLFLIPVVFWLVWQKGHKGQLRYKYLLAGILGFIVSARCLEIGVHYFCIISDNPVSRFINGRTAAFVVYGVLMAGVFEECGRHLILKYIMKRDRSRENAVLYGIGHGGIEVLMVVLPAIALQFVFAVMARSGDISGALSALKVTEETAAAVLPTVKAASEFGAGMLVMSVWERLVAMCIHIGLTVIVFYGVVNRRKAFLPLAIGLHAAADVFPALYQRAVVPMWACELWCTLWTALIVIIAVRLYHRLSVHSA